MVLAPRRLHVQLIRSPVVAVAWVLADIADIRVGLDIGRPVSRLSV